MLLQVVAAFMDASAAVPASCLALKSAERVNLIKISSHILTNTIVSMNNKGVQMFDKSAIRRRIQVAPAALAYMERVWLAMCKLLMCLSVLQAVALPVSECRESMRLLWQRVAMIVCRM